MEPSLNPYFFGVEAIESKLRPGQNRIPNSAWKDFCDELKNPYQGMQKLFLRITNFVQVGH